ncbi:unnamed protein product [Dibothriocephalus latus]|uniref:kynurenine--oxoglutarate transaminase n=1 Tax=Dibothriocephalus latus TaxID=60516 RepID=A0A3P6T9Q2_DIBLA|nr:unnamed protein product [Dibothriocephalus latus]
MDPNLNGRRRAFKKSSPEALLSLLNVLFIKRIFSKRTHCCFQGFPDYMANKEILKNLRTTTNDDVSPFLHQYARAAGHPRFVNALAKLLEHRVRHDPAVFSVEELKKIADICIRHNLICLADEVYEWLVFPPKKHYKIVTGWKIGWTVGPERYISAMQIIQQNTVYTCATPLQVSSTIHSHAGLLYCFLFAMRLQHWVFFHCLSVLFFPQEALAITIEHELPLLGTEKSFFHQITQDIMRKSQRIADALKKVGMPAIIPQAGYFLLASIEKMPLPENSTQSGEKQTKDVAFNEWMMINKGVAAVPPTVFCCQKHQQLFENYLRFCIIKDDATIDKFVERLNNW